MNSSELRDRELETLLKLAASRISQIERKIAGLGENAARADKPNPNDEPQGSIEIGYTTSAIAPRSGTTAGTGTVKRCYLAGGTTITDRGLPDVTVNNFTGGTGPIQRYIAMSQNREQAWIWESRDCASDTYNGQTGTTTPSAPPANPTPMTNSDGTPLTNQDGTAMTTQ